MNLIMGSELSREIRTQLREENERDGIQPVLAVLNVGDNSNNLLYIGLKESAIQQIGGRSEIVSLHQDISREGLLEEIERFNHAPEVHGILLQLPLSPALEPNREEFMAAIRPDKDVDGFNPVNWMGLSSGHYYYANCAAQAALNIMKQYKGELAGLKVVMAGDSIDLIQPLSLLLLREQVILTIVPSWPEGYYIDCDIAVVEKGGPHIISPEHIAENCLLIDNGFYYGLDSKIKGNVDKDAFSQSEQEGWLLPVPGGLGPMLITQLMMNIHQAARR